MNDYVRRTGVENDIPVMKNLVGKAALIPSMRSKSRALEDVENLCKPFAALHSSKEEAMARQRANADKLSKGFSVVHSKANLDKENFKETGKEVARAGFRGFGKDLGNSTSLSNRRGTTIGSARSEKPTFVVPVKPAKQTKKPPLQPSLQKSQSLTILQSIQEKKPEVVAESPLVVDDDQKFEKDEFLLGVYAKDIYKFLKRLEKQQEVRRNYLTQQHIMTESMRAVLVDWMFEVQVSFDLLQDTAQMAVALLDRFMQNTPRVPKEALQLVGVTCIFIASKYEELYPPGVGELVEVSAEACSKQEILEMEQRIFRSLNFNLGRPPPVQFLRRYCRMAQVNTLTYMMSKYFVDLALVQYSFCHVPPSLLAAAALYLAIFVQPNGPQDDKVWTPTLVFFSEYSIKDLQPLLPRLARLILQAPKLKQQCVQQMYANQRKKPSVSTRPELSSEKLISLSRTDS